MLSGSEVTLSGSEVAQGAEWKSPRARHLRVRLSLFFVGRSVGCKVASLK